MVIQITLARQSMHSNARTFLMSPGLKQAPLCQVSSGMTRMFGLHLSGSLCRGFRCIIAKLLMRLSLRSCARCLHSGDAMERCLRSLLLSEKPALVANMNHKLALHGQPELHWHCYLTAMIVALKNRINMKDERNECFVKESDQLRQRQWPPAKRTRGSKS